MKNKTLISYLVYLIKMMAGIILLIYVLRKNDVKIAELYNRDTLILLVMLLLIQIIIFVLSSYRWVIIFRHMSGQTLSIRQGLLIAWIGQFYSCFLPDIISSDVSRFYYINKIYPGFKNNAYSIVKDRIVALISLTLLTLGCLLAYLNNGVFIFYLLCAFLVFALFVAATSKITEKYRIPKAAFIISFVTFNFKAYALVTIVLFLNLSQNFSSAFYLSMFGQLFEIIPLTPANMGIGHLAYDLIFKLEPGIVGVIVYNYYFTAKFLFKLAGGVPWIFYRSKKKI